MNGLSGATLFRAILWLALTLPATVHSAVREIDDELRAKLKATISQATSFSDRYEAEVWLVQKSTVLARFIDSPQERLRILKEVHKAAKQVGLPPEFVLSVIHIESAFDPYAVSRVGAQGMMQVMPFWKKEIGRESDNLIKLETNLQYGCTILKYYLDKENGHWADALARYNGSYGRYTYSHKVINVWTKYWR
ncbi:lytic transglycosylase domain-containing protein [Teredinibacter turnerae]|uniref:lytic transglycosylase domain-containing protein n=1 Tax=Teredinibacter turnerae TaxID=2426 RepID=UPI00036A820D|nr:lytic transglycosylase domain-containing protein [Teredinibacter turnerae]